MEKCDFKEAFAFTPRRKAALELRHRPLAVRACQMPYAKFRKEEEAAWPAFALGKGILYLKGKDNGLSQVLFKKWEALGLSPQELMPLAEPPVFPGSLRLIVVKIPGKGALAVPCREVPGLKKALDSAPLDSLTSADLAKARLTAEIIPAAHAKATVTARIKTSPLQRKEARRLKKGDILPLHGEIQLISAGRPFGKASLCRQGKQKAVRWKS